MSMTRADHISTDADYSKEGLVTINEKSFEWLIEQANTIENLEEVNKILVKGLKFYSGKTLLEEPSDWDCFKEGGYPDIGAYEIVEDVASESLYEAKKIIPLDNHLLNPSKIRE